MTDKRVKDEVEAAILSLKDEQPPRDFDSVHERSTAHRLAVHLDQRFLGWKVDCEYDRDRQVEKLLIGISECDQSRATDKILPDIVIHHRVGRPATITYW